MTVAEIKQRIATHEAYRQAAIRAYTDTGSDAALRKSEEHAATILRLQVKLSELTIGTNQRIKELVSILKLLVERHDEQMLTAAEWDAARKAINE